MKKALITGATSGIGEAVARLLAKQGISLILTGRNRDQLEQLALELKPQVAVETLVADLALPNEREIVAAKIRTALPDLLINNAGIGLYGDALSHPKENQMAIIKIDVEALVDLTLEAARALVENKKEGIILNVSSAAAFMTFPKFAAYSASKAFVNQFSESLDWELKSQGIRVLAACPGVVATHFRERAGGKEQTKDAMTADYAAEQIWWQIQKRKPLHIFNWRYRIATFLTRYILPKSLVARVVDKAINRITE